MIAAVGDDADDRLADIAHLAARQRQDRRGVVIRHARGREQRLDQIAYIVRGEYGNDARRGTRAGAVDRADARMGLIASPERNVQHVHHLAVVGVGAEPGEQPRILAALDTRADNFWPGMDFGCVVHGRSWPLSTTARIALTMCS